MPKGVVWRHEDVFFALGGGYDAYTNEPVPHDRFLAERAASGEGIQLRSLTLPPLMHGAGQWGSLRFFFEGNLVVFQERFDPREAWELIEREQLTNIMMTGDAMARPLIEALRDLERERAVDLSSLFVIASSAVVFSQSVKNEFLERFPNVMIFDSIGSTETGQNGMTAVTRDGAMSAGGPTVTASPEAVVLDDHHVPVGPGSGVVGRLARTGHIPLRYHNDPDKSAATFVTGGDGKRYAVAGDNVVLEADGTITLLGRDSVCINSGGEKIFTEEVEAVVRSHPDVYDAIIVGVPDDRWGQRVAAVVQARPGRRSRRSSRSMPTAATSSPATRFPASCISSMRSSLRGRQARLPVGGHGGDGQSLRRDRAVSTRPLPRWQAPEPHPTSKEQVP